MITFSDAGKAGECGTSENHGGMSATTKFRSFEQSMLQNVFAYACKVSTGRDLTQDLQQAG